MYRIRIDHGPGGQVEFDCRDGDTLLGGALRAGVPFPYECAVGACGSCKSELLQGEVSCDRNDLLGISERDRARSRILACQSVPQGDCTLKVRVGPRSYPGPRPTTINLRLVRAKNLTVDMREFVFSAEGPAAFLPGQFALFSIPGVIGRRAYSMSNVPNDEGIWQFIVKRIPDGQGSNYLFNELQPGDSLLVDAPYGLAYRREESQRKALCIAGGSGLAPALSIARSIALSGEGQKVLFYYGGRRKVDLCAEEMVSKLPGFGSSVFYVEAVSEGLLSEAELPCTRSGFIHEVVDRELGERIREFEIYMAGPPVMLKAMLELSMIKYRVPAEQVHFDRFF